MLNSSLTEALRTVTLVFMTREEQVPVSERALIQRINRRLSKEDQMLCRTRERWSSDLGRYHTIDLSRNSLVAKHINLEKLGRETGALKPWERLVDEAGEV